MGWGSSWDKEIADDTTNEARKQLNTLVDKIAGDPSAKAFFGIDLGTGDHTIETTFKDGQVHHRVIPNREFYNNLKPTHDPYTNPNTTIYYECACGAILDPNTKSFAQLNNHASVKGWKIRFSEKGYTPYCVKCGEDVE